MRGPTKLGKGLMVPAVGASSVSWLIFASNPVLDDAATAAAYRSKKMLLALSLSQRKELLVVLGLPLGPEQELPLQPNEIIHTISLT